VGGRKSCTPGSQEWKGRDYTRPFFILYFVYIIKSEQTGRYYCGYSSNPERRLRQHNDPHYRLSQNTKRLKDLGNLSGQNPAKAAAPVSADHVRLASKEMV